ncbi:MAG: trigger factor [Brevefilum sp.]
MKIEKTIQDDRQAKLTVEYTQEEFEGFKRRAARKIAKKAKIPGFRPGKAPFQVIVNHYGEGTILQEAIDILLDDDYGKMLEDAEIEPSGSGNLEKIESYDPPTFEFLIPLEPEVDLGDYQEIRKDYELEEFDISKVDDFIEDVRRNSATIIPAEHPAQEGDLVYFNLTGEFLNLEEDEDAMITEKTPQQVVIPDNDETSESEWPFPGFSRELIGVEAGDTKEIQHTFSDDHEDESYQGKTAIFTIEVQSVKELELPEFDEDFVQTLGNYDSPEDFKEKAEERLRKEHQSNYDQTYFNELLNEITENTEMNYPPQMLEHEEEHVLEDIKSRLKNQNMDFETYLKLRDTDEETFMEEEIRPVAKDRLERTLIVDALIEAEGLKLDQKMLQQNINDVMTEVFSSGNAQEMQKQMGKDEFSRAISMEGVQRTMNEQLQERLKLIATGQPIPEEEEVEETSEEVGADLEEEIEIHEEAGSVAEDVVEEKIQAPSEAEAEEEAEETSEEVVADLEEEIELHEEAGSVAEDVVEEKIQAPSKAEAEEEAEETSEEEPDVSNDEPSEEDKEEK